MCAAEGQKCFYAENVLSNFDFSPGSNDDYKTSFWQRARSLPVPIGGPASSHPRHRLAPAPPSSHSTSLTGDQSKSTAHLALIPSSLLSPPQYALASAHSLYWRLTLRARFAHSLHGGRW